MRMNEFREEVHAIFGEGMEYATPAHMRLFLDRMHERLAGAITDEQRLVIPKEPAANYEQVVAQFFARVLNLPPEQAVILLWLVAGEMFYARLGEQYQQELSNLLVFDIPE